MNEPMKGIRPQVWTKTTYFGSSLNPGFKLRKKKNRWLNFEPVLGSSASQPGLDLTQILQFLQTAYLTCEL